MVWGGTFYDVKGASEIGDTLGSRHPFVDTPWVLANESFGFPDVVGRKMMLMGLNMTLASRKRSLFLAPSIVTLTNLLS